jgi:hypothetical protein
VAYRSLLHLYPTGFRREFGEAMDTTFQDWIEDAAGVCPNQVAWIWRLARAWFTVLKEIPPTAAHEHMDAMSQWSFTDLLRVATRGLGLALIPVVAWYLSDHFGARREELTALWLGIAGLAAGAIVAGGHGTKSLFLATVGAVLGFGLPVAFDLWIHPPVDAGLSGVAVLVASVGTIALAAATYIRLLVEGLVVRRSMALSSQ